VYKNDGSGELHVFEKSDSKYRHFQINKGRIVEEQEIWNQHTFQLLISTLRQVTTKAIPKTSKNKIKELINEEKNTII